ncbi:MAG: class I SAM-dependent methyltransferase [Anaerolineae bacterium]|nr:class I SAM-dependent methyltransferase [Anaerolineae bacterium]
MSASHLTKSCYTAHRREILPLVPPSATRILDVGCAHGYLGRTIKEMRAAEIVGIEINVDQAEQARQFLDRVYVEDIETFLPPYPDEHFDCLIMADILEHLVDPWRVLQAYARYLAPAGIAVISVPNVRHYRVIGRLILGSWRYEESGILDSGHLRFFTLDTLLEMVEGAGLEPARVEQIYRARPSARFLNRLMFNRLEAFLAQQYVVQARKTRRVLA